MDVESEQSWNCEDEAEAHVVRMSSDRPEVGHRWSTREKWLSIPSLFA